MRNISFPSVLSNYKNIEDITDSLPKHPTKVYRLQEIDTKDTIVVHHTALYAPLENHAKYHIKENFPGIAYHIIVSDDQIYQTNDLRAESYHTKGHNHHTIGICINADLSKRSITDRERELMAVAIMTVRALVPSIKKVLPHNALVKTACPCTSVPAILDVVTRIEQEVEHAKTPEKREELAYRIANELTYLFYMSKGKDRYGKDLDVNEHQKLWAQERLILLEPEMRRLGFLK